MKAGHDITGEVMDCWPVHPGAGRMAELHGEWVRDHLRQPVAKVRWSDEEITYERTTNLRVVREDIVTLYARVEAMKRLDPRSRGTGADLAALYLDLEVVVRNAGWTFPEYLATLARA
jgi:hypothetical protein